MNSLKKKWYYVVNKKWKASEIVVKHSDLYRNNI